MKLFDKILLILVRQRLARVSGDPYRLHDGAASHLSDALLQAVGAELARRNSCGEQFDRKAFEVSLARTQIQLQAAIEFADLSTGSVIHFQ